MAEYPQLLHTVLDTTRPRQLAEFYRQLLGLRYRPGDEPPADAEADDGATMRTGSCSSTQQGRASSRSSSSTS